MKLNKQDFESKLPKDFETTLLNGLNLYHKNGKYFGAFDRKKQIGIIDHSHKGSGEALSNKLSETFDDPKKELKSIQEAYLEIIESTEKIHTILVNRRGETKEHKGTLADLIDDHSYTLETGKSYEHEKGNHKINTNPSNIKQLVDHLNKAKSNASRNGNPDTSYSLK